MSFKTRINHLAHRKSFRIALIVLFAAGLLAAWGATLIQPSINHQDPDEVAAQFISDLQLKRPNHAFELMSPEMRKMYADSSDKFASDGMTSIASQWPGYKPDHIQPKTPIKFKNDDTTASMFIIPSDGLVKAQQVQIRLVRSKAGEPWKVDAVSSITHINGKIAPGAL